MQVFVPTTIAGVAVQDWAVPEPEESGHEGGAVTVVEAVVCPKLQVTVVAEGTVKVASLASGKLSQRGSKNVPLVAQQKVFGTNVPRLCAKVCVPAPVKVKVCVTAIAEPLLGIQFVPEEVRHASLCVVLSKYAL